MKWISYLVTFFVFSIIPLFSQQLVFTTGEGHPLVPIATEILTKAYNRIGVTFTVEEYPAARSILVVNSDVSDGVLFRGEVGVDLYPDLIKIPVTIAVGQMTLFTMGLDFEVYGWESLRPYSLCGHVGVKEVLDNTEGMNIEFVASPETALKMLIAGRHEVVLLPLDVGLLAIKENNLVGIRILDTPLERNEQYHFIHKKHKELLPLITQALQEMEREGQIEAITQEVEAWLYN